MRDSIRIIGVKTLIYCIILAVYCMFYITLLYNLIYALSLTLRHLILTTFYDSSCVFIPLLLHPFKNIYNSSNNHNRVMYKSYDLGVKKIRLNPSIDPFIIFSDSLWYAKGVNYEFIERLRIYLLASDTSEHLYYLYDW